MRKVKFGIFFIALLFCFIVGVPTILVILLGFLGGIPFIESLKDPTLSIAVTLFIFIVVILFVGGTFTILFNRFKEKNKTDLEKFKELVQSKFVKATIKNSFICYIAIILALTFFGNTVINSYFCKLNFEEAYWVRIYAADDTYTSVPATIKMSYFPPFKREITLVYFEYLSKDYDFIYEDTYVVKTGVIQKINYRDRSLLVELTDKKINK